MSSDPGFSLDPADPEFQAVWAAASSDTGWAVVDYDPNVWMEMPVLTDPDNAASDRRTWARRVADAIWTGYHVDPFEVDRTALLLTKIAEDLGGFKVRAHQIFLHLPEPRTMPLPVGLGIWKSARETTEQLRLLVGADDPEAVEPPIVDDFVTDQLGSGLRCLRYLRDDQEQATLIAALNYAWRVGELETDYRLFTASVDLGRLTGCIGDIDNLARSIQPIPL